MTFSQTYRFDETFGKASNEPPFNELILSWNGERPKIGKWTFWVSLHEGEWLKYAEWSAEGQQSFKSVGNFAQCYQDAATPREGFTDRFEVKVEGEDLSGLRSLTVCISNLAHYAAQIPKNLPSIVLPSVPLQSQLTLDHPRKNDLCSPTSMTTALNYLLGKKEVDPLKFAENARDQGFDIYGNWILNVAEGYAQTKIPCHVERLSSFEEIHRQLLQNRPVVVSIKGPIAGAPKPYQFGHLLTVIGYEEGRVVCIDSAFSTDEETFVKYELKDFLEAWGRRFNLAYVFDIVCASR